MSIYINSGDLYCSNCLHYAIYPELTVKTSRSVKYDFPRYCIGCGEFMKNALTKEGYDFIENAFEDPDCDKEVIQEWKVFYGYDKEYNEKNIKIMKKLKYNIKKNINNIIKSRPELGKDL